MLDNQLIFVHTLDPKLAIKLKNGYCIVFHLIFNRNFCYCLACNSSLQLNQLGVFWSIFATSYACILSLLPCKTRPPELNLSNALIISFPTGVSIAINYFCTIELLFLKVWAWFKDGQPNTIYTENANDLKLMCWAVFTKIAVVFSKILFGFKKSVDTFVTSLLSFFKSEVLNDRFFLTGLWRLIFLLSLYLFQTKKYMFLIV